MTSMVSGSSPGAITVTSAAWDSPTDEASRASSGGALSREQATKLAASIRMAADLGKGNDFILLLQSLQESPPRRMYPPLLEARTSLSPADRWLP